MSIGMQSYAELYTTLIGWDLYDKLWLLLTKTGIAFIPFIGIILKNFSQHSAIRLPSSASSALRNMEYSLLTTLFLIFIGASPVMQLDAQTLSYTATCKTDEMPNASPGDTGTTFDKAFSIPTSDIRIPILWYAVIAVSEGLTNSAKSFVGCVPNLRKMVTQLDMTQIKDPAVKEQLLDFESMCYLPARTMYLTDVRNDNSTNLDRIQKNTKEFGDDDINWLGSKSFNEVYYKDLYAKKSIKGFPYNASQDINAETNTTTPDAGTPNCYEWWNDSTNGLRKNVLKALPDTYLNEYKAYIKTDRDENNVISALISNETKQFRGYDNASNFSGKILSNWTASAGILYHQITEYPKIYAASQAAPIIQALLLLLFYVFLPFILVFTNYSPRTFTTTAIVIFSLIFWSFIWYLVSYTDKALMQALYSSWIGKQGPGATLADMIMGIMIIVAPLFWFSALGAMGLAAGSVIGNAFGIMSNVGERAGAKGPEVVKEISKSTASVTGFLK